MTTEAEIVRGEAPLNRDEFDACEAAIERHVGSFYEAGRSLMRIRDQGLAELRRRGFKLGILSNCSCQAGAVIYRLGLSDLVDAVTLSFEVGLAKPDPAIYRAASAALGLAPAACVFVADGAGGELEAASALGMLTIKIRRPNQRGPEDLAVRADYRVESLNEVLSLESGAWSQPEPQTPDQRL